MPSAIIIRDTMQTRR